MRRKRFLVCVDSDGCAIDTMDAKHKLCFAPLMTEKWQMEEHREEAEEIWNRISLYSMIGESTVLRDWNWRCWSAGKEAIFRRI